MIKIAICDDEKLICNELEEMLEKLAKEYLQKFDIDVFYSGEDLCSYLNKDEYYDIVFLDIELKTMNDVEVGQIIREQMLNETIQIIYISSKESYAMELFKIRPLDFIIKPFNYERIKDVFKTALKLIQKDENIFKYKIKNTTYNTLIKNIMYFESKNREVIIHKVDGTAMFYEKLKNIYKELKIFKFIKVHKSYLVNYSHISKLEYHQITMINGDVLPISQSNRKEIRAFQLELERERGKIISGDSRR